MHEIYIGAGHPGSDHSPPGTPVKAETGERGMGNLGRTEERPAVRRGGAGQVRGLHNEEPQVADERLAQGEQDQLIAASNV